MNKSRYPHCDDDSYKDDDGHKHDGGYKDDGGHKHDGGHKDRGGYKDSGEGRAIPPTGGKWYPGHYIKILPESVITSTGTINTKSLDTIFKELNDTYCLRGIKWVIEWGDIENVLSGQANWNWKIIDELARRCWKMTQGANPKYKRLMIAINLEAGGVGATAMKRLLPPDLAVAGGFKPTKPGYTAYLKAYPWTKSKKADGYYIKLWDTTVQNRFEAFCQALANHVVPNTDGKTLDTGDVLCMVTTLESATSPPYDGYQGGSKSSYEAGLFEVNKRMKRSFKKTPVTMGLNFDRAFLEEIVPQLPALKIGINTPNVAATKGLSYKGDPCGMHAYYQDPTYCNSILLTCESQGDDYKSTVGIDARKDKFGVEDPPGYDFPSYKSLYEKHRDVLNVHYIVWMRNNPFWLGGTFSEALEPTDPSYPGHNRKVTWPSPPNPMPSLLNFLKTHKPLNNPNDPAGGLNSAKPYNWL